MDSAVFGGNVYKFWVFAVERRDIKPNAELLKAVNRALTSQPFAIKAIALRTHRFELVFAAKLYSGVVGVYERRRVLHYSGSTGKLH